MISLAIHAHFYQPPREDPATGAVPVEPSAAPFANWNQRITAECYRPNAELGNFERLSYDVGPTLYAWLEGAAPEIFHRMVAADRAASDETGRALAQSYHHLILPLASRAEKELEVAWGITEFEHRYGRRPRGLWLPETAADPETLEVLAEAGMEFTILAPWQADEPVETTEAYWVEPVPGRRLAVFFYDASLSGRLSFDVGATDDADRFADQLEQSGLRAAERHDGDRLVLLASDGELYGHHQKFRDKFLARLTGVSAPGAGLTLTHLESWLDRHPPQRTVGVSEPGSWSCHHGVDRWDAGCACTTGSSAWKRPLRAAFDNLAVEVDRLYDQLATGLVDDPRRLRHRWVEVLLGRLSAAELLAQEAPYPPSDEEVRRLVRLLEACRHRHRMFTSCGWFVAGLDSLEPRINLAAAAAAAVLCRAATGDDLARETWADLHEVPRPHHGDSAAEIFADLLDRLAHQGVALPAGMGERRVRPEPPTGS